MNKDDIKKALECCYECPYFDGLKHKICVDEQLHKDALNLITEQEQEIKKQNGRVKCLKTRLANKTVLLANVEEQYEYKTKCFEEEKQILANTIKKQDEEYDKAFERLKAQQREIERLKAENDKYAELFKMKDKDFFTITVEEWEKFKSGVLAQIKQSKIDVLNELKQVIHCDVFDQLCPDCAKAGASVLEQIDDLIKEIENNVQSKED